MIDIHYVPVESIQEIEWKGDYKEYDYNLFQLGQGYDEFMVVNPLFSYYDFYKNIKLERKTNRCIVWKYKGDWIVKYFNKHWDIEKRYLEIDLEINWQRNPEIETSIVFNNDPSTEPIKDLYDLNYEMIWYVDPKLTDSKIWIYQSSLSNTNPLGPKEMGIVSIANSTQLDVVFISYDEPNAEENWRRVLEKSPKAFRVNGVKGIANAHKCAAELASTDMFYVVDGDSYLSDEWTFDFQPGIFDRDCVHVWRSINPINGLTYGYGGVKLLPRQLTLDVDINNTDMTTSIGDKFKLMSKISNSTNFNTSEFNTFRSAFRECAKLSGKTMKRQLSRESETRLNVWCTTGADKPFGEWAIKGANAGRDFGKANLDNQANLALINDYEWLKTEFSKLLVLNNILLGEI
jgi:hypothetical protein